MADIFDLDLGDLGLIEDDSKNQPTDGDVLNKDGSVVPPEDEHKDDNPEDHNTDDDKEFNADGTPKEKDIEHKDDSNVDDKGEKKDDEGADDADDSVAKYYNALAKNLIESGAIDDLEEGAAINNMDDLTGAINNKIQKANQTYVNGLDPRVKWLQNNIEKGVSLESLLEIDKNKTELSKFNEDQVKGNPEVQKKLVKLYYKNSTNFTNEKIDKMIDNLELTEGLEDEALSSLKDYNNMVTKTEQDLVTKAEEQKRQEEQVFNDFIKKVEALDNVVPGIKLNKTSKEKVLNLMMSPVAKDQQGRSLNALGVARNKDPYGFDFKLNYIWNMTKGFTDFSNFASSGKKAAIREFEDMARNMDKSGNKLNSKQHKPAEKKTDKEISKEVEDTFQSINLF